MLKRKPTCNKRLLAWWVISLWCWCGNVQAQMMCSEVPNLSQGTNEFIYRSTTDQLFISSLDGLNIYDGVHTRIYHPATHTLYGSNIQSPFFEDATGKVWFSTYEALHYYDPARDDFEYFFMVSSAGDTIQDNYKVFYLDDTELYLKAGTEVFVFDIVRKKIKQIIRLNLADKSYLLWEPLKTGVLFVAATTSELSLYLMDGQGGFKLVHQVKMNVASMLLNNHQLLVGTANGNLYAIDIMTFALRELAVLPRSISGIERLNDSILVISNYSDTIYFFNLQASRVVQKSTMMAADGSNESLTSISQLYMDRDSILWIDVERGNIYSHNLKGRKFSHWLEGVDITSVLPYGNGQWVVLTRLNGILHIDANGKVIRQWRELNGFRKNFSSSCGLWLDPEKLLFTAYDSLYQLILPYGPIKKLTMQGTARIGIFHLARISNGLIIVSNGDSVLYDVTLIGDTAYLNPYVDLSGLTTMLLRFYEDDSATLYISNDDKNIFVLKPDEIRKSHLYAYTLDIPGGIKWIHDANDGKHVYVATTQGVSRLNKLTRSFSRVVDMDKLLSQTVYTIAADRKGLLWMSTNSGLIQYRPETNEARLFSMIDGLQGNEFNTNVCYHAPGGEMLFGGRNGLNYFHPDEIRVRHEPANIYISSVRINDETSNTFLAPEWIDHYDLPYTENTISFNFHAIDYTDPFRTQVKYRLIGMDEAYVESESTEGSIRYANLPPGKYTLSIIGRNADGVWNTEPREIAIFINPPFWRTWWFLSLAVLGLLAICYLVIRSFFKQKLRRQAIIIEKQQAVEQERTRIAAEMHDDLGAGLTTIRYLSDKALKQAVNPEEVKQIQRIADQSNALVRNMSEIIWAMNSRFDTTESLVSYLRRYAVEYLSENNVPIIFNASDKNSHHIITGEKRRNIFLVVKELLHNTVKYSGASSVQMDIDMDGTFELAIRELGGIGFDPQVDLGKGNGLYNCERRMKSIGGALTFGRKLESMDITLSVPLTS